MENISTKVSIKKKPLDKFFEVFLFVRKLRIGKDRIIRLHISVYRSLMKRNRLQLNNFYSTKCLNGKISLKKSKKIKTKIIHEIS